jgi:type IV secretion system protein VirB10
MSTIEELAGQRTEVAKTSKRNDKWLLIGMIGVCALIGLSNLLPKRDTGYPIEQDEKQDSTQALRQNMELIAKLKEKGAQLPVSQPVATAPTNNTFTKETLARMNAPSTFFSVSGEESIASGVAGVKTATKTLTGHDRNSDFLNQQNDIASVSAKQLPHPSFTVPAGEMIPATLETAINSELAGMTRAITTRDIYALSGNKLLIPKGSTLVGQFNAAVTQGQNRIFVVWGRVQMTNGVIVTLNSPSADAIGRSGQAADYIDRHFFERFGNGVLLSVLGAVLIVIGLGLGIA